MTDHSSSSLIRIGESLHCHIPSVQESARRWLCGDALDHEAGERHLLSLVKQQAAAGADYLDVNVDDLLSMDGIGEEGARQIMGHILRLIIEHGTGLPPCIDSSDPQLLEWGLKHYFEELGGRAAPVLNSVTITRLEPLAMRSDYAFGIVGMLLEQSGGTSGFTDIAGPEAYHQTAREIFDHAVKAGFAPGEVFFDPTVGPLGADMVGYTKRTFEGIRSIRADTDMQGVHVCLGLSNCSDGLPRRLALNRAYLRVAMEYGVDAAIVDASQISGKDLVDGRILKLIRQIATGDSMDALPLLVDFAQGHPRPQAAPKREPLPDQFGADLADQTKPVFLLELVPSEQNVDQILAMAEQARDTPFTFTITDTPSGNRTPGPDAIAVEVGRIMGRQPIVNLSCKSDDRNGLFQRTLGLYHQGLRNFFAVTGDFPQGGRGIFDLDAVTLQLALTCLRRGLEFPSLLPRPRGALEGLRAGAAISPFKYAEPDLWGQYLKMWKKRQAGAAYFISQVGWDIRKFQELRMYAERAGMGEVPLIGSVYHLTPQVVKVLSRVHVAGVVIPADLKKKYQGQLLPPDDRKRTRALSFSELADFHHRFSIRQSALLADILVRGLGYRGIDLGGVSEMAHALEILESMRELESRDWHESWEEFRSGGGVGTPPMQLAPDEGGYYLFPTGADGLLEDGPYQTADRTGYRHQSGAMGRLHRLFFEEGRGLNGLLSGIARGREEGGRVRLMTLFEQAVKSNSLGCEMCGDCRIAELHYMCPEPTDGCAKRLLNGPCAGADVDGMCEVDSQRRCYWGRVMEAALSSDGLAPLAPIQPPKDPSLQHTSSWRNEALGLRAEALDFGRPEPEGLPADKPT